MWCSGAGMSLRGSSSCTRDAHFEKLAQLDVV
jgi:hypothetical protein